MRMLLPGREMRVLVACEFSGVVRDAFIDRGHFAMSCDLIPSQVPGPHYTGDVREVLDWRWDLMIAHPPCTYLAISGRRWWHERRQEQEEALDFIRLLMDAPIDRICIENPVGKISTAIRKPDQIIQPWQFGHEEAKATCLWLKNLLPLEPTEIVEIRESTTNNIYGGDVGRKRSITFQGIADAMADQWGLLGA